MKRFVFSILVFFTCFLAPSSVLAREDQFTVDIYFQSEDEDVNTFGTSLELPDSWRIDKVALKDSNLIYWVEAPVEKFGETISFSGIFPGGVRNLNNYRSPLLLFSIQVSGDISLSNQLFFENTEIYLNHPMALEASTSRFASQVRAIEKSMLLDLAALDDLDYEFTVDPVTNVHSLVLNNYRGALASYIFELQEGDFWLGEWSRINGVASLNAQTSTVSLFITSPDGEQETMVLRSSFFRTLAIAFGVIGGLLIMIYLFILSLRVLRFDPLDEKRGERSAIHSIARSREAIRVKYIKI